MNLSLARPPWHELKNVINPDGEIPTKNYSIMVFITRLQLNNGFGLSIKASIQFRMTRHLLFSVLINASAKLSRIASRGNQATKFYNNLLNNFA